METIGLIHYTRHVGFQIVMQISYVLCWAANTGKKANCRKSARRNIEIALSTFYNNFICLIAIDILTFYFVISFFTKKNIDVTCVIIPFSSLGDKHSMNVKQIICVAKMFVLTSGKCVVCPLRSV